MHATLGKCNALWGKSTSPKSAEIIEAICGKTIIRPCATRWNSLFDALSGLNEVRGKLSEICEALELPVLGNKDMDFISAYISVLSPIASSLDILQGQDNVYMADIYPEILQIVKELNSDNIQ